MIGGLIYAELGTRLPDTGGECVYITRCFGPLAGFMFEWAQLFIIRTSPAAGLAIIAAD
jgi:amino acid transporter